MTLLVALQKNYRCEPLSSSPMSAFAAALLVSPARSSIVAVTATDGDMLALVGAINGDSEEAFSKELAIMRPWRLAEQRVFATRVEAEQCACSVRAASGVRARLTALRSCDVSSGHKHKQLANTCAFDGSPSSLEHTLDGLTYVLAEFSNPDKPSRHIGPVRVMVDTGSTDCELSGERIQSLRLKAHETALFETAAGITTEAPVYRANIKVLGREATVLLSPAEGEDDDDDDDDDESEGEGEEDFDERFGFEKTSDGGLLGHDALAALGLAVDCRHRRLVLLPDDQEVFRSEAYSEASSWSRGATDAADTEAVLLGGVRYEY